ncbi:thioredoxin family protein [Candidatus Uabimicrobium amorphum]|uniref:Thiol reductase thioredoxin n=1 Tax=Uabimicrobium amorphum TaxID=2596890 RepID=A0A5S9F1L2_UABAM|nr:thioredoxin domain-containing protein [Candidatus Uabimicrobium amorphum]BBM82775.1 thiol reductase thioredoxin [Candidatus Uabimicrobium amorphum]
MPKGLFFIIGITLNVIIAHDAFQNFTFEQACSEAEKNKKLVMIDFYTTWCGPCKRLDRTTWKDAQVKKWLNDNTIALKIDAEKERALSKKLKIKAYPTMIFINSKGQEQGRIVGYRNASGFIADAQEILKGKDPIAIAKEKLEKKGKDDPSNVMRYARVLIQNEKYEEALEKLLWCFDHGLEKKSSFVGVRSSFLLSEISHLGKEYPQAITALSKRYEERKQKMNNETARKMDISDFVTLGEVLKKDSEVMAMYDQLSDKQSVNRSLLGRQLFAQLLALKRYKDIIHDNPDLLQQMDKEIASYQKMQKSPSMVKYPSLLTKLRKMAVKNGAKYYEVLLGINRTQDAQKMQDKIIAFDATEPTYHLLIQHAQSANVQNAVNSLQELLRTKFSK